MKEEAKNIIKNYLKNGNFTYLLSKNTFDCFQMSCGDCLINKITDVSCYLTIAKNEREIIEELKQELPEFFI